MSQRQAATTAAPETWHNAEKGSSANDFLHDWRGKPHILISRKRLSIMQEKIFLV